MHMIFYAAIYYCLDRILIVSHVLKVLNHSRPHRPYNFVQVLPLQMPSAFFVNVLSTIVVAESIAYAEKTIQIQK